MPNKEFMDTQTGTVKERGKKVFMANFVQRSRDKIRRNLNERAMVRQNRTINPAEDPDRRRSNPQRRMKAEMDAELFGNMSAATANRPTTNTTNTPSATIRTRPNPVPSPQTALISAASAATAIRASVHGNPTACPQHRRGKDMAPAAPSTSSDNGSSSSSPPDASDGDAAAAEVAALRKKYAHVNRGFWPAAARELVEAAEAVEAEEERAMEKAERYRNRAAAVRAGKARKAAKERMEIEKKKATEKEKRFEKRKRVLEDEEENSDDDEPVVTPRRKLRRVGRLVGRS